MDTGWISAVMRQYGCTVFDIISRDCTLEELSTFLSTVYQLKPEQFESGLRRLLELKQERPNGTLGTEDMLEQVKQWEDMRYCPVAPEQFKKILHQLLPSCQDKAADKWAAFAKECVELGQYVDFKPVPDQEEAVGRWLESLLAGLYKSRIKYGDELTAKVCGLAQLENPVCLYPSEILQAADLLKAGVSPEKIVDMVSNGEIEAESPFFPKSCDYEELAEMIRQNRMEEREEIEAETGRTMGWQN